MKFAKKKDLAARYSCSLRTIENWMGFLPFYKVKGAVRFNVEECDEALARFKQNRGRPGAHSPPRTLGAPAAAALSFPCLTSYGLQGVNTNQRTTARSAAAEESR